TVLARAWCLSRQLKSLLKTQSTAQSKPKSDNAANPPQVGIWLPPGIDFVVANLAAAFCGATIVPLDPQAPPDKQQAIFESCQFLQILSTAETLRRWPLPHSASNTSKTLETIDIAELHQKTSALRRIFTKTCAVLLPGFMMDR